MNVGSYGFLAAHLRFVAAKTAPETAEVAAMMAELKRIAAEVEADGGFTVPADRLRLAGRALAGVAGFLQQHILPEAVAAGHGPGEAQVRWVIDTCMEMMTTLTVHADAGGDAESLTLALPAPPTMPEG